MDEPEQDARGLGHQLHAEVSLSRARRIDAGLEGIAPESLKLQPRGDSAFLCRLRRYRRPAIGAAEQPPVAGGAVQARPLAERRLVVQRSGAEVGGARLRPTEVVRERRCRCCIRENGIVVDRDVEDVPEPGPSAVEALPASDDAAPRGAVRNHDREVDVGQAEDDVPDPRAHVRRRALAAHQDESECVREPGIDDRPERPEATSGSAQHQRMRGPREALQHPPNPRPGFGATSRPGPKHPAWTGGGGRTRSTS